MHLLTVFQWLGQSSLGRYMQKSIWAFAVVETLHLIALAALGGSLLLIHLRLLGVWSKTSPRDLVSALSPIVSGGLITMILTGILMVSEEALKCYYSPAFRAKMLALGIALLLYVAVTAVGRTNRTGQIAWWLRAGAALSLLSWLCIGLAGRAIGLL